MDEEKQIAVSYNLEYLDMQKAFYESYFTNWRYLSITIFSCICLAGCIVAIVYNAITAGPNMYREMFYAIAATVFMIFILRPVFTTLKLGANWGSTQRIPKGQSWLITFEQIIITRQFGQLALPWNFFFRIVEYRSSFCFYPSMLEYYIIPKRALTEEQIIQLRSLIRLSANPQVVKIKLKK